MGSVVKGVGCHCGARIPVNLGVYALWFERVAYFLCLPIRVSLKRWLFLNLLLFCYGVYLFLSLYCAAGLKADAYPFGFCPFPGGVI